MKFHVTKISIHRVQVEMIIDFSVLLQLKLIHFNDELEIRLQLWDIAGQVRNTFLPNLVRQIFVSIFVSFRIS